MSTDQKYIILFGDSATDDQIAQCIKDLESHGGVVLERFVLIKGFSATISNEYIDELKSIQGDLIKSIEPDGTATTQP